MQEITERGHEVLTYLSKLWSLTRYISTVSKRVRTVLPEHLLRYGNNIPITYSPDRSLGILNPLLLRLSLITGNSKVCGFSTESFLRDTACLNPISDWQPWTQEMQGLLLDGETINFLSSETTISVISDGDQPCGYSVQATGNYSEHLYLFTVMHCRQALKQCAYVLNISIPVDEMSNELL